MYLHNITSIITSITWSNSSRRALTRPWTTSMRIYVRRPAVVAAAAVALTRLCGPSERFNVKAVRVRFFIRPRSISWTGVKIRDIPFQESVTPRHPHTVDCDD